MDALKLLENLVKIHSPSKGERKIVEYLLKLLDDRDPLVYERDDIINIVINPESDVWVVTHVDTVSVKRDFEFDGRYAYGTGVCDAKANVAAIVLALSEIEKLNIGIALLSDEEEDGLGSKFLVEEFKPRKAIVLEPTDLKIAKRNYGSLEIIVDVRGLSAHGSTPEFGINAIEKAIELIKKIKDLGCEFSVQEISGGSSEYVIPDKCRFRIDFTIPPDKSVDEIEQRVLGVLEGFRYDVVEKSDGFISGEVCEILERALRFTGMDIEYCEMKSWTDAINLKNAGWDVVVFGPGELHLCHTERERIKIEDVIKTRDVIKALNEVVEEE